MAKLRLNVARAPLRRDLTILAVGFVLYTLNNLLLKPLTLPPLASWLVRGHLNDALCGLAFMAYTNCLFDVVRPAARVRSPWVAAAYMFGCGLFWEFVAPLVKPSTSDWADVASYVIGALLYWLVDRARRTRDRASRP